MIRLMEAAQIGREYGLELAEGRLKGFSEFKSLSWAYVRKRLRDERDA